MKVLWENLKSKLFKKKVVEEPVVDTGWVKRIVINGIRGELAPGVITVDVGTFDADGNYLGFLDVKEVKVIPTMRATCNRVLSGIGTLEDQALFESWILNS